MTATTSLLTVLAAQYPTWDVYELRVPDNADMPYIWLGRRGVQALGVLSPDATDWLTFVDVEVYDTDPDTALDQADTMRTYLSTLTGTFGAGTVQGLQVEDQSDDYQIRNPAADEAACAGLLNVTIINYRES